MVPAYGAEHALEGFGVACRQTKEQRIPRGKITRVTTELGPRQQPRTRNAFEKRSRQWQIRDEQLHLLVGVKLQHACTLSN